MRYFKHMCHSHEDEKLQELLEHFGPEGYGVYWLLVERVGLNLQDFNVFRQHSVKNWAKFCEIRPTKLLKMVKFMSNPENFSQKEPLIFSKLEENQLLIKIPNLIKYRDEYSTKLMRKSGQTPDNVRTNSGGSLDNVQRNQNQNQNQNQKKNNINKSSVSGIPKSINNTKRDQKQKSGSDLPEAADDFEFFIREKHKDITGKSLNSNNQTNIQAIEELRNYPIEIIDIAADITKRRGGKGLKYLLRVVETEYNNPDNYIKSREKMIHHCTKDGAAIHKFSLKHNNGKFDQDPKHGFYMCLKCHKQWNSFEEIKCRE